LQDERIEGVGSEEEKDTAYAKTPGQNFYEWPIRSLEMAMSKSPMCREKGSTIPADCLKDLRSELNWQSNNNQKNRR
jgi:hypothetical protein